MSGTSSAPLRRILLAVGIVAVVLMAVQISVGGVRVQIFGVRASSHSFVRPLLIALVAAAVVLWRSSRAATLSDLRRLDMWLERGAPWIAALTAAAAMSIGVLWGTRAAGGSDSYCYIGQAVEFAAGRAILVEPLAREIGLPHADLLFAPVGFIPSPRGGAVPMCAPGLSLLMALAWKAGGDTALHVVVPCLGALAVWCAFLLGRRLQDATTGACAALLLCISPVFLYQIVQPMSDVPAAALWSAALASVSRGGPSGQIGGGIAASLALLIRPNLAPVIVPLAAFIFVTGRSAGLLRFLVTLIPACTLLAWLNHVRYGSPLRTGYGDLEGLFSLSHVLPNFQRYGQWILDSQTPLILLAFAAPLLVHSRDRARNGAWKAFMWTGIAVVLAVLGCYLPYTVFDAWWYTRFLLPALPIALALTSASLVALASRTPVRSILLLPMAAALASIYLSYARSHGAFWLRDFERRFITAGTYVARTLPDDAVMITGQQSGATRHYGRRPAALWDAVAPDALDETVAQLSKIGRTPYFLLEDGEESGFRERFKGERLGALDWPPAAVIREEVTVRLYDPAARPTSPR